MEKIIERNVPIAEENVTLSGQPATNMFEDWSENITETDLLHEEKDKGLSPKKNPKKLWGIERSGFFNGREKWAKGFENQRV